MQVDTVREHHPRAPAAQHPLLLPHQLASLRACLDLEAGCDSLVVDETETASTRCGILGDKPGSGKSFVVAALLLGCGLEHLPGEVPRQRAVSAHLSVTTRPPAGQSLLPVSVLVVPHNIVAQWSGVLRRFSEPDRYREVYRAADLPAADEAISALRGASSPVRVIAVTASLFPDVLALLRAHGSGASRIVFDEADSLRFRSPGEHRTAFRWFVTASAENLVSFGYDAGFPVCVRHSDGAVETPVNSRQPLCSSSHVRSFFALPCSTWCRSLAKTIVVSDNAFVDGSFDLLPPETVRVPCAAPLHTRVLDGIASREVIARLNAGDLETALAQLHPERTDSEPNIISAALAHLEAELGNARAVQEFVRRRQYASAAQHGLAEERQAARVARLQQNIEHVRQRIQGADECLVCFSEMTNKTVVPCCSNSFCLRCITTWVTASSPSCPMCKRHLRTTDFLVCCDAPREAPTAEYTAGGVLFDRLRPKEHNLARLLRALAADRRKVLFFCDNEYTLQHAGRPAMSSAGLPAAPLKGNASSINKRVREFNDGDGPRALLVNCSHYGCGLNLSQATDVVLYHTVDSRMDQQVIGRAQRPPRAGRLRVWRFVNSAGPPPAGM